mgnify:CR=1 FL=1
MKEAIIIFMLAMAFVYASNKDYEDQILAENMVEAANQ